MYIYSFSDIPQIFVKKVIITTVFIYSYNVYAAAAKTGTGMVLSSFSTTDIDKVVETSKSGLKWM